MSIKGSTERKKDEESYRKVFLSLQENAPAKMAGKMMDVFKNMWFECIDHPPFSQNLSLFPVSTH